MVFISLNNNLIVSSINNNYKFVFFGLLLIIYFAWMDIALFINLQGWKIPNPSDNKTFKKTHSEVFSTFDPLSVKLIMVDHGTHYVHDILARFIEDNLHFSSIFPWVTANLVSYAGLLMALVGSRLVISDKPMHYRLGAIMFDLRNLADSLDGVVYRSRKRQQEFGKIGVYESNYGSYGYNVDVICDGLGGLLFCIAILIKFLKHLPTTYPSNVLIRRPRSKSVRSNSGEANYELIQMDFPEEDSLSRNINQEYSQRKHISPFQVKLMVVSFGLRLLFTGLIWDHFVHKYHDLLMVASNNSNVRKMQEQAFKSISMWLIMWFWRLGNACAMLEHLSVTVFFNKLWEYLVFTNYIGWIYLIVLSLLTQIHYTEMYESFNSFSNFA